MVDHGFNISDGIHYFGQRVGHCFGIKYPPYELSADGCVAFKKHLLPQLKRTKDELKHLQSGNVETVHEIVRKREGGRYTDVTLTYKKGENGFDRVLQNYVYRAEQQLDHLKSDIDVMNRKIKDWVAKPLEYGTYSEKSK
jgi:hypothetical protein